MLCTFAACFLQSASPVVQLHPKGTAQGGGGLGVGDLHHIYVTVCGAEITAVEGGHLGLGLLKGGPRSVLQDSGKLPIEMQSKGEEQDSGWCMGWLMQNISVIVCTSLES